MRLANAGTRKQQGQGRAASAAGTRKPSAIVETSSRELVEALCLACIEFKRFRGFLTDSAVHIEIYVYVFLPSDHELDR